MFVQIKIGEDHEIYFDQQEKQIGFQRIFSLSVRSISVCYESLLYQFATKANVSLYQNICVYFFLYI